MPDSRVYAGASAEQRRQRRQEAFLEAALTVGDDIGWRQVTVDRLTQQAKLSKRYFYDLFTDIDTLGGAVVDHLAAELSTVIAISLAEGRAAGEPVPQLAHTVIGALVRYVTDDPRRARLLFGELSSTDAVVRHRAEAIRGISRQVITIAREVHHDGLEAEHTIIATSAALLIGGTGQAILAWLDGTLTSSRDQLVDDLATLWVITGDGTADYVRAQLAD